MIIETTYNVEDEIIFYNKQKPNKGKIMNITASVMIGKQQVHYGIKIEEGTYISLPESEITSKCK